MPRTALLTSSLMAALGAVLAGATPALAAADEPAGGAAIGQIALATVGASIATGVLVLLGFAHRDGRTQLLARPARWLGRRMGMPIWAALPSLVIEVSLITALIGMYWDISLHIDVGRDAGPLANPAHYLILAGLFGIFAAGFLAMVLHTEQRSASAVQLARGWSVPLGSVIIFACAGFALMGFPLDDVWHRLFGQDVTLWGPTHLMLIGGAALTLVGQSVLIAEGVRSRRAEADAAPGPGRPEAPSWHLTLRRGALAGAFLVGLSTFQAEFDFGVPQFDQVFQPMLIALAASVALVSARVGGGRGAALLAVAFFLLIRGLVSLSVGPVLGQTMPHFPLYVVEALAVEGAAFLLLARRPLAFGALAGALIGTVGFAAEWAWTQIFMPIPWAAALLPDAAIVALVTGVAGGLLGVLIGTALMWDRVALPRRSGFAAAGAAVAVVAVIGFGLSTASQPGVSAAVALREIPGGDGRHVSATVRLDPPSAADDARWLTVTAWQGGGLVVDRLERTGEGTYRTTHPIPVHGEWKAMILLHAGRSLNALPLYLPEDSAIPAPEVAATPRFTRAFVPAVDVLQREAKAAPGPLKPVGYGVVLAIAASLLAMIAWALRRFASEPRPPRGGAGPARPAAPGQRRREPAVTA